MANIIDPFKQQSDFCKVLAHPTRQAILLILREGEQCVCHMEAMLKLRQANISQHLMILREAGLVADRRDGWNIYYHVIQPGVFPVLDAIYQLTGQPHSIEHVHADGDCPCPKCDTDSSPGTCS